MVRGVTSLILSLTISAVGWIWAVSPHKNSTYVMPEFIRKHWKSRMGPHYEYLYEKLQDISKRGVIKNPATLSKLKLSLNLLDYRFRQSYGHNVIDRVQDQLDFWASRFGFFLYPLSFYEDLILTTIVLLSSDSQSKQELMCESLWKEFFSFDDGKIELQNSKFLLPMLEVLGNLSTLPEGSKFVKTLGLANWVEEQTSSNTPSVALESWRLYQNLKSHSQISYSNKVYPLIPPYLNEEPLVDIIFVHGIKGGASFTWRQHDSEKEKPILNSRTRECILNSNDPDSRNNILQKFYTWIWPLDWVKTSIKLPARLITLNYPADFWKTSNIFHMNHSLEELSQDFIQDLILAGVGTRPIIWVTHSLGGLLLKNIFQAVNKAKEKESLRLCCSTKGIVFYSVPHFGSPLSSWTYLFSCVWKPSSLLYSMTSDKSYLNQLHQTFVKTCDENNIEVISINETKPASLTAAGPKILFVSPESGNPGIGDFHEVDTSHLYVCKPVDRSTPSYAILQVFILKLLEMPFQ